LHSFIQEHFKRKKNLALKQEKQKHCTSHNDFYLLNFITPNIGTCPVCGKFISKNKLTSKERSLFNKAFRQKELEKKWDEKCEEEDFEDCWLNEIYETA
jgi:hypothetical protein